ncbi:hypothetical protein HOC13_02940 [Candidatus Woesearchaeota archaeon]|nr:hypothetical protein [Candidatus Woesearchaeota archaeon]
MNKNGGVFDITQKIVFWPIAIFIIIIILFAVSGMLFGYRNSLVEIPVQLKAEAVAIRFLNAPECFTYVDEEGIINPGVIEASKFTQDQMYDCYHTPGGTEGAKWLNFKIEIEGYGELKTEEFYEGSIIFPLYKNVLVKDGDNFFGKRMIIYVQEKI